MPFKKLLLLFSKLLNIPRGITREREGENTRSASALIYIAFVLRKEVWQKKSDMNLEKQLKKERTFFRWGNGSVLRWDRRFMYNMMLCGYFDLVLTNVLIEYSSQDFEIHIWKKIISETHQCKNFSFIFCQCWEVSFWKLMKFTADNQITQFDDSTLEYSFVHVYLIYSKF